MITAGAAMGMRHALLRVRRFRRVAQASVRDCREDGQRRANAWRACHLAVQGLSLFPLERCFRYVLGRSATRRANPSVLPGPAGIHGGVALRDRREAGCDRARRGQQAPPVGRLSASDSRFQSCSLLCRFAQALPLGKAPRPWQSGWRAIRDPHGKRGFSAEEVLGHPIESCTLQVGLRTTVFRCDRFPPFARSLPPRSPSSRTRGAGESRMRSGFLRALFRRSRSSGSQDDRGINLA